MPTSEKVNLASRYRAIELGGTSPQSFGSFLAYQSLLQTQQARRMMRKVAYMFDSTIISSVPVVEKEDPPRGPQPRKRPRRYLRKKRQHRVMREMHQLQSRSPTPTTVIPQNASVLSSPSCSSPSSSSSSTSSSVSSHLSPSPTPTPTPPSPPPTIHQLTPLTNVCVGFGPQNTASPDAQTSPATTTDVSQNGGTTSPTAKKKYPCELCEKSFDYKHVLQNHYRTHTGEKPYQCPQCQKRFTRDHHLKTHIRLHTGEKPFGCAICHKRFVQVANLRRHERVHASGRPDRCGHGHGNSDLEFSDSTGSKVSNLPYADGSEPSRCAACGARFRRKRHRNGHKCAFGRTPNAADESSTSSTASSALSATRTPLSIVPSPGSTLSSPSASESSTSSSPDLDLNHANLDPNPNVDRVDANIEEVGDGDKRRVDEADGSRIVDHSDISPLATENSCPEGCLKMDVGFRVIRSDLYHPPGRRYETWPRLHRQLGLQPCQEQPEDLSIKK